MLPSEHGSLTPFRIKQQCCLEAQFRSSLCILASLGSSLSLIMSHTFDLLQTIWPSFAEYHFPSPMQGKVEGISRGCLRPPVCHAQHATGGSGRLPWSAGHDIGKVHGGILNSHGWRGRFRSARRLHISRGDNEQGSQLLGKLCHDAHTSNKVKTIKKSHNGFTHLSNKFEQVLAHSFPR